MKVLWEKDREVAEAIAREEKRQSQQIELIAAENYTSPAVLEAQGSVLTNKYAEGYPGARYYGGCHEVDVAEDLARDRAKALFGADHANVQPHSGSQANMAAYFALLNYGDTILAMSLAHGGHLTHGHPVNFSGKLYHFVNYGVRRDTEVIDYDEVARLAEERHPRLIVAGASAYPRFFDFPRLRAIADSVGAYLMVDMAHIAGLIAGGVHPSPIPYAHVVTSTTHKTLRGPRSGFILCQAGLAGKIDKAVFPGLQGGPLMHVVAAKAVGFGEAMKPEFKAYARAIVDNARTMATELSRLGLRLISGGTDNHMMLVDLTPAGITGQAAEEALEAVGIAVNRNAIPFDTRPPRVTSGIRVGTPAVTTRGMGAVEMKAVAGMIMRVLSHPGDEKTARAVREEALELSRRFPIPGAAA